MPQMVHGASYLGPGGVASPTPRASCCRLSIVIGTTTALIVLAVAATTFAITYTASRDTVEAIGVQYVQAIVDGARAQVAAQYTQIEAQAAGTRRFIYTSDVSLPSEGPTNFSVINRMEDIVVQHVLMLPGVLFTAAIVFNDGSGSLVADAGGFLVGATVNTNTIPPNATCCGVGRRFDMVPGEGDNNTAYVRVQPSRVGTDDTIADLRPIPHYLAVLFFRVTPSSMGFWISPTYEAFTGTWCMPLSVPLRNFTALIGVYYSCPSMGQLRELLVALQLTANARVLVIQSETGAVVESTRDTVESQKTFTSNPAPSLEPGCSVSSTGSFETDEANYTIACLPLARDFSDPVVRHAASVPALIQPAATRDIEVRRISVGGETLFVGATAVQVSLDGFPLSLLAILPEQDILGDIERSRDVVIAVVCAVFVIAAALSTLIIVVVLRPVGQVSEHMKRTAQLQEYEVEEQVSSLHEVAELQLAFQQIHRAMHSFTRYVPRDVVKDLMATGDLCAIRMMPADCTMLFCDIAGFTALCEKVSPQVLSGLVELYFSTMSRVVMRHGGLIDKFIGDCIMAVWGTPFSIDHKEVRATLCALQLVRCCAVEPLHSAFDAEGELLDVRVGIATGRVLAGNMGSEDRMNYTVIGDAVNLAARLESLNKQLGTSVLVCETTHERLGAWFVDRLMFRIAVVGKQHAVATYNVVGLAPREATLDWAELRRPDVGGVRPETSTAASRVSLVSVTVKERRFSPFKLMEMARQLVEAPLVATEAQVGAACTFTAAAQAYAKGQLEDVGELLNGIPPEAGGVSKAEAVSESRAAQLLRSLVEDVRANPAKYTPFDGVWRPELK